jgi:hypothetical protein
MTWKSYNAFIAGLGNGGHLVPALAVLAVLMILALAMARRDRRRRRPS